MSLLQIDKFPVDFTEKALERVTSILVEDEELDETFAVRVSCQGGGCAGVKLNLDFDDEPDDSDFRKKFAYNDTVVNVWVDPHSAPYLKGVVVDYVRKGLSEGFEFKGGDLTKRRCGCGKSFAL